jgi:hypothetical protein
VGRWRHRKPDPLSGPRISGFGQPLFRRHPHISGTASCACAAIQASRVGLALRAGSAPPALSEKAPYLLKVGWVELEGSDSVTHDPDSPSDSM